MGQIQKDKAHQFVNSLTSDDLKNQNIEQISHLMLNSPAKLSSIRQILKQHQLVDPPKAFSPTDKFEDEICYMMSLQSQIYQKIIQVMATGKLYHIRENFRKLILNILKLENLSYFLFLDSGRVEYHDFKENFITQILQSSENKKLIQKVLASSSETIQKVDIEKDTTFLKLFDSNLNNSIEKLILKGQVNKSNEKYSVVSLYSVKDDCSSASTQISNKLLHSIIKISLIEIEDESQYNITQFYCKQLLDILVLIVNENEAKLKQKFSSLYAKCKPTQSISEMSKSLSQELANQQIVDSSMKYQQFRFQLLQRARVYGKYVIQKDIIFMEFNQTGSLSFLANNLKQHALSAKLAKLHLSEQLYIEKIFFDNLKLLAHIKKALAGGTKNKKNYQVEKGTKVRVTQNEDDQIERISINIQVPIESMGSCSTFGASENNKKTTNSDDNSLSPKKRNSGCSLMSKIQKENPGVTGKDSWLNLFIKDHQRKRKDSVMSKKKMNLFNRAVEQNQYNLTSMKDLVMEYAEQINHLNVYSPDLNLLEVQADHMEGFTKRVFSEMKFFNRKEISKQYFENFLIDMRIGYETHTNPFHNFYHGVNVMHTCFLISNLEKNKNVLTPLKIFTTVLSGLCHDVGHTGRTNSFEIASGSRKALNYNDNSPLQNFHASTTFEILRKPENNFLQKLSTQEKKQIRADIISNILFTDIKEHFPLIKKFKGIQNVSQQGKIMSNEETLVLTGMITHTSDFGGSAKKFEICRQWSRRVNIEFMAQYKQESELGLPQTPFFKDLDIEPIFAKNQMGFLKVIVFPLYEALDQFYQQQSTIKTLKQHVEQNIESWQKVRKDSQLQKTKDGNLND